MFSQLIYGECHGDKQKKNPTHELKAFKLHLNSCLNCVLYKYPAYSTICSKVRNEDDQFDNKTKNLLPTMC